LNTLEQQVTISSQDLKMPKHASRPALTMVRYNRAAEFPTIGVDPGIQTLRHSPNEPYFPASVGTGARSPFTLPFDVSCEVDLWGLISSMRWFQSRVPKWRTDVAWRRHFDTKSRSRETSRFRSQPWQLVTQMHFV
jgi:hypothetical protein